MGDRKNRPFYPIDTSDAPSFNSTALSTASAYVLETTARLWQGPSNRAVRIANVGSEISSTFSYYVKFGSSTVVAASSNSFLCVPNLPHEFYVTPSQTYVSLMSTATVTVNVTLGYGG